VARQLHLFCERDALQKGGTKMEGVPLNSDAILLAFDAAAFGVAVLVFGVNGSARRIGRRRGSRRARRLH
jgi:hypothetical protein